MSFDTMLKDARRREMEVGARNAEAARTRIADVVEGQRQSALSERARSLDCSAFTRELDARAREIGAEPMRLKGDKIDISANILRPDDFELIGSNRAKIIMILEARSLRTQL